MVIEINDIPFTLLSEKALYKPDERLLIIADIHLGKASHFRKEGLAIPAEAQMADYTNLQKLFEKITPLKVYFLGDLFHSSFNRDWHYFTDLIAVFPHIEFVLIKGNHDIINKNLFKEIQVAVVDSIEDDHFLYTHEPIETARGKVNITGHIHPGIVIFGAARQSLKLSCFYVSDTLVVLPAFGMLTGLYSQAKPEDACVYCVLPDGVRRIM
jgi:DNA ligase-associated metallophosphoesterase